MKAIAEILKNRFHIPVIDGLVRHSDIQQKELNYEERLSNIRGKIYTNKKLIGNVSDRIVLFDDVFTTGATASECARVLKTWGIKEVRVLTITID
jgi:predicted amidophosphoribosyltransferase